MASANAIARIDWTITWVEEPGLRPTASDALAPIQPTARAAPRAARPTCRLPIMVCARFLCSVLRMRACRPWLVMLTDEQREHRRQQHEHQRLHQTDQQLQEVERDLHQPTNARNAGHRFEHGFSGEDVAVQPEAQ